LLIEFDPRARPADTLRSVSAGHTLNERMRELFWRPCLVPPTYGIGILNFVSAKRRLRQQSSVSAGHTLNERMREL
jgi:hypothetical protein